MQIGIKIRVGILLGLILLPNALAQERLSPPTRALWQRADELGLHRRVEMPQCLYALHRFDGAIPRYYATSNYRAARTANVPLPTEPTALKLSGRDVNVGIWDGGSLRLTHWEFGPRAVSVDQPGYTHYHATHIAGTIGAYGMELGARGMAPHCNLFSYTWEEDAREMEQAAADAPGLRDRLPVSNHSYGIAAGWRYGYWSGQDRWTWFVGETEMEDPAFGKYDALCAEWDRIQWEAPWYQVVNSAGNGRYDGPDAGDLVAFWNPDQEEFERTHYIPGTHAPRNGALQKGYATLSTPACSKNAIVVGAVADAVAESGERQLFLAEFQPYSGCGPTDDGRLKPDLVANGRYLFSAGNRGDKKYEVHSGTSQATASVSGCLLLLIELYRRYHPDGDLRASTLKALLLHHADDMGLTGPDYRYGWGLINLERAAFFLNRHPEPLSPKSVPEAGWTEDTLEGQSRKVYPLYWNGKLPLKATLCWTDAPSTPSNPLTLNDPTPALVYDFDLRIRNEEGVVFLPWLPDPQAPETPAGKGDNGRDNVEQVFVERGEPAGVYYVEVSGKGTLPSTLPYSLCVSAFETETAEKPQGTERWQSEMSLEQGWTGEMPRYLIDVNRDGLDDLAGFGDKGLLVSLSRGDRFAPAELWLSDFGASQGWNAREHERFLADVNGDTFPDAVGCGDTGVFVAEGLGTGFAAPKIWSRDLTTSYGWHNDRHLRLMADMNQDGTADVVAFGEKDTRIFYSIYGRFTSSTLVCADLAWQQGWRKGRHLRTIANVTEDRFPEIVAIGEGGVYVSEVERVYQRQNWEHQPPKLWGPIFTPLQGWQPERWPRMLADVNGDGRDDLLGFDDAGCQVALSTGGGFSPPTLWLEDLGFNQGWRVDRHPRLTADLNDDGFVDLFAFGGRGCFVSLSNGNCFLSPALWVEDFGTRQHWGHPGHLRLLGNVDGDSLVDIVGFGDRKVWVY